MQKGELTESVESWMSNKPVTCTTKHTVSDAAKIMQSNKIGALIVTKERPKFLSIGNKTKIVGIVTDTDIVRKVVAMGEKAYLISVQRILTPAIQTIQSTQMLIEASRIMAENRIKRLPVVDNKELVGIITTTDIMLAGAKFHDMKTTRRMLNQEQANLEVAKNAKDKNCAGAWMTKNPATIPESSTVQIAASLMKKKGIGALLVTKEENKLRGIITDTDIIRKVIAHDLDPKATHVSSIMSSDVISISEDTHLGDLASLLSHKKFKRTPVVNNGKLVGIISTTDIVRALFNSAHSQQADSIISMMTSR